MNFVSITRRIRRCENEAAAQVVFEHAIATAIANALETEREACAKISPNELNVTANLMPHAVWKIYQDAIRARGGK